MKWSLLVTLLASIVLLSGSAVAQYNQHTALLLPLETIDDPIVEVTSSVVRSVPFEPTGTVSPWGVTEDTSTGKMLFSEIRQPFVVQTREKDLTLISSITLAIPNMSSMTGIAYDPKNDTIWGLDTFNAILYEANKTTGQPTGNSVVLTAGTTVPGPCSLDVNDGMGGDTMYYEDISQDKIYGLNIRTGVLDGCVHDNPLGTGVYGNGISYSYAPSFTGELWATSGLGSAGRPTDIFVGNPCFDVPYVQYVDLLAAAPIENFWQEIQHTVDPDVPGTFVFYCVGGNSNILFEIKAPKGVEDCQGIDGENVLFINGDNGQNVTLVDGWPFHFGIQKPSAGGPGQFFVHMNSGTPIDFTITTLPLGLGDTCFPVLFPPFGGAAPVSVWNNVGRTDKVGSSNYYGTTISDPNPAPTFFQESITGDTSNMPVGSIFTMQGVILNPGSSAAKPASVTNAILVTVEAQP